MTAARCLVGRDCRDAFPDLAKACARPRCRFPGQPRPLPARGRRLARARPATPRQAPRRRL